MAFFYKYEYTNKRKNIHPCNLANMAKKYWLYLIQALYLISYVCAILKYTFDRKTNEPGY